MSAYIARPESSEYGPFYAGYVAEVPDGDLLSLMERQGEETFALFAGLPEERGAHRYAPEKWSIKDIVLHLADAERVFAYRALRFARNDTTPLPGFDENDYARGAGADARSLADLAAELRAVRRSSLAFFRGLAEPAFLRKGTASGFTITVRALAWITAGHERHHIRVVHERYL